MKTARLVAINFGVLAALGIAGLAIAAPPAGVALADATTMPSATLSASAIVTPTATVTGTVPITGTPTVTGTIANNQKVANAIATYFNVPLTEILALRGDGMGYGGIVIAYNLAKQTGQSVDEIIALREAGAGWGKIVQSLDVKPGRWRGNLGGIMSGQTSGKPDANATPPPAKNGDSRGKSNENGNGQGNGKGKGR